MEVSALTGKQSFFGSKTKVHKYSDAEVVEALGRRDKSMEEWFYNSVRRYFDEHFNSVFFDKDRRQEVFQSAFLKLWMEIDNGRICVIDGTVCRQQQDLTWKPMSCALTTFLMAFARTEFREIVRSNKEQTFDELFERAGNADNMQTSFDKEEDEDTVRMRLIDECLQQMPPSCLEIITMFYYQGCSLDQIMEARADRTSSKNGLKTAKNKCMNTLRQKATAMYKMYNL